MNTIEINNFLLNFKNFKGTYPRDLLPKSLEKNCGIVINTDTSQEPGEHWVAIYMHNTNAEYFDSFGLPPLHKEIINFLDKISPNGWSYNTICFQSLHSQTCGNYCVLFLTNYLNGGTFAIFQSIFNFKKDINDRIAEILYKIQK